MATKQPIRHIGIILDGNRRWAQKKGLPTLLGHKRGYDKMKAAAEWCAKRGIKILTVYAFSSENWDRSKEEVKYLMDLFREGFKKNVDELSGRGIRIKVIGQKERLPKDLQELIKQAESKTSNNKKLLFNIGISYGGRPDIIQAVKKIVAQKIPAARINEKTLARYLWTEGGHDPDVIVRTSGEYRLSNFLTWQSAYSELFFLKKNWPDFSEQDLDRIIKEFNQRQRRFGK
jgi:undecaprenyl diphosphate synthase